MTQIVVVPGHAQPVHKDCDRGRQLASRHSAATLQEWAFGNWFFVGCFPGEAALLAAHILAGVSLALQKGVYLFFSGGQTRSHLVGDLTEADGNLAYAVSEAGLNPDYPLLKLERWARASEENTSFTIALALQEVAEIKADPSKMRLTCVGWGFKTERFVRQAAILRVWLMSKGIYLPSDWFEYIGVNDPPAIPTGEAQLLAKLDDDPLLLCEQGKRVKRVGFGPGEPPYSAINKSWGLLPDLDYLPGACS